MTQDVPQEPHADAATSQPAATMLEPEYHPFAEEIAQMGGQPASGASAPDAERVPEDATHPADTTAATEPEPQGEQADAPDFRTAYAELQRKYEESEQQRQQFEQQQQQWLELQQRENARKAEEQRKQAEEGYKARLKSVFEKAVSADDDDKGLAEIDRFIREDIAAQLVQHFQQQLDDERRQYEQNLTQFQQQATQQIEDMHRPGFVRHMVQQNGLPESAVTYLMGMPIAEVEQKAAELKALLAQAAPQIQQKAIEQAADQRRASGVHAVGGVSGGPLPPRELAPMSADSPEAVAIARALLSS